MSRIKTGAIKIVNRQGGYLFLSVSHSGVRKFKSLGFKCDKKYWDAKRELCLSGLDNYRGVNVQITSEKMKVIERMNSFIIAGKDYNVDDLLLDEVIDIRSKSIKKVINDLVNDKCLSASSINSYNSMCKRLLCWLKRDDLDVDKIDDGLVNRFVKHLEDEGMKSTSIGVFVKKLNSIMNYADKKGLVSFSGFDIKMEKGSIRNYKRKGILNKYQLELFMDYFYSLILKPGWKSGRWSYRDDDAIIRMVSDSKSIEYKCMVWVLSYLFQGLAAIDIFMLRKSDIENVQIGGKMYYRISTKRMKTKQPVKIVVERNVRSMSIINALMGFVKGEHLLSLFNVIDDSSSKERMSKCGAFTYPCNKTIKKVMKSLNHKIIERNVNHNTNEPLIDADNITLYSARHTFASMLINNGASLNALASLLGRSIQGIECYVKQLQDDEEIIGIREKIGL